MPNRLNAEAVFLAHLDWIDKVAARTSRGYGVGATEAEDFAAWVKMRIMDDDYAVLRKFRGESKIKTFISVLVVRQASAYFRERSGGWRPSPAARSAGELAVQLEALVYRDGYSTEEAGEMLRQRGDTSLSDRELRSLLVNLPGPATSLGRSTQESLSTLAIEPELVHRLQQFGRATDDISNVDIQGAPDPELIAAKQRIAVLAGGLLTSAQIASALRTSASAVHQMVKAQELLAVALPNGEIGFPALQIQENGTVRSGVAEVVRAGSHIDAWVLLSILIDDVADASSGILLEHLHKPVVLADVLNRLATYGEHVAG